MIPNSYACKICKIAVSVFVARQIKHFNIWKISSAFKIAASVYIIFSSLEYFFKVLKHSVSSTPLTVTSVSHLEMFVNYFYIIFSG